MPDIAAINAHLAETMEGVVYADISVTTTGGSFLVSLEYYLVEGGRAYALHPKGKYPVGGDLMDLANLNRVGKYRSDRKYLPKCNLIKYSDLRKRLSL